MKLKDFDDVALEDYIVGVIEGNNHIDMFHNDDYEKLEKYKNGTVSTIHVHDESTMFVTVKV